MKTPLRRIRNGAVSLAIVFFLSLFGYRFLGDYDWIESFWMVVITISTVGFGEHSQEPASVQLLTIFLILFGVSAAAYTCGGFLQMMLEGEVEKALGKRKMTLEINKLTDHVIICGFSRLGQDLAAQLKHRVIPFVIVDITPDKIIQANELGYLTVTGDATSEAVMAGAGLEKARSLASALPTDAENVFITLTARNLRPDIQIIAKSEHESSCRKLRQAGANKIVMPHRVGAQQMERMISRPTTADLVELFAEASHLEMELDEIKITNASSLCGNDLAKSKIKETYNLLVVGIKNAKGDFRFNPPPEEVIGCGDTLLVIGQVPDINRLKSEHRR
ncbi:MAG: NAD-binding protein [Pirellulaceae bacterium]